MAAYQAAARALCEHLSPDWGSATLVIVPPTAGNIGAPPAVTIRIDNPAHATAAPTD